ncbi:DUF885 domain-containing protein [Ramlibacter sp.]|uniref:DUF885 domain-containing protein n=1 Tax=Ramlibacter sp. TaxID=1917967 RepID=UPI002CDDEE65|nr:DUF885 domain-containing protein [Ramlibacter sp.]HWI82239.1 DUF885 domain-containing protein [Ramlibacter sp.]
MRRLLAAAALALSLAAPAAAAADAQEAAALHALFQRHWEELARRFPEDATQRGDLRYNDRFADQTPEAIAAWDARSREWLREAQAIRPERLGRADQLSRELFIGQLERQVQQQAFPGYRTLVVGALGGVQSDFADLMRVVPVGTSAQVEQLLQRIASYPALVEQEIAKMRRGAALGWVSSRPVLRRALAQIDEQLAAPLASSPYTEPFRRLGADIPAAQRAALQARGEQAVQAQVLPAMGRLRAFLAGEYAQQAPAGGAMRDYPDGARVYEFLVRRQTTTALSAAEIHEMGQRELARIRAEMDGVLRQVNFDGGFADFVRFLNTDARFFHRSPEELLDGYRAVAKRIDAELPRLFAQLPRAPYGVRAMPAFQGPDAAEYYNGPARDGSRAGYFNANTVGWRTRPKWKMATLTAHEAVPGHHLQIARGQELEGLPEFRRQGGYNAFVEGWAVYAETLGREIGLYEDPYSLFGHLQWQAFRAARLVADTGIHHLGWSRERTIEFMVERTGMDRGFVTSEVDRYTSIPGQALGYMVGKLKIAELRERAQQRLGPRFDLRRFHNAVIDQGALPLDVLERVIEDWIARELVRG